MSPPSAAPPRNRWRLPAAAAMALALAAAAAYFMPMPKYAAPNAVFTSLSGERIALAQLRGKVVLVNFWAASCAICVHEMPAMVDLYKRYAGQGLQFVAVAMSYDPPNYVLNYAQTRKLPFTVALDPQDELAHAFGGVDATPTTFLIGKDGNILERYIGVPEAGALQRSLEQALAAPG